MGVRQIYNKEKANITIARLKKGGETFEISVDPDAALAFKKGNGEWNDVLKSEEIFADVQRGQLASSAEMQSAFNTDDKKEVAKNIVMDGEIHLTSEYRDNVRKEKEKKLMDLIIRNAIDPRTNAPIPLTRMENAFAEAKVHVDDNRSAEEQMEDVIDKLRPILPLKFEMKKFQIRVPATFANKVYGMIKSYNPQKEEWMDDGSLMVVLEMPVAMQNDFYDKLNSVTHGGVETKEVK